MSHKRTGGVLVKYLILLVFVGLLVGYFYWINQQGVTGVIQHIDFNTADHIAFVRQSADGKPEIFVVKADGTGLKPLTNDKRGKRSPAWAPNGKQLCYSAEDRAGGSTTYQLFLVGAGDPRQATYNTLAKDLPRWRPDGKQIAFLSGGAIKVMDANGSNTEQIYPSPHRGGSPASGGNGEAHNEAEEAMRMPPMIAYEWSPTGASLAGVREAEGDNAPAQGEQRWWGKDHKEAPSAAAVLEPEGVILLRSLEEDPMPLRGSDAQRVTFSWFPDSKRIAVAMATRQGLSGIAIFRTDEPDITPKGVYASTGYVIEAENPAVSPDGTQIAFEAWQIGSDDNRVLLGIAVLPTEAEQAFRVTTAKEAAALPIRIKGAATKPQWSPDGTRLLYSMPGKAGRDLWVARADGSNAVNLTKGEGDNSDAVWSPLKP